MQLNLNKRWQSNIIGSGLEPGSIKSELQNYQRTKEESKEKAIRKSNSSLGEKAFLLRAQHMPAETSSPTGVEILPELESKIGWNRIQSKIQKPVKSIAVEDLPRRETSTKHLLHQQPDIGKSEPLKTSPNRQRSIY